MGAARAVANIELIEEAIRCLEGDVPPRNTVRIIDDVRIAPVTDEQTHCVEIV
jgi:hypothetical protein